MRLRLAPRGVTLTGGTPANCQVPSRLPALRDWDWTGTDGEIDANHSHRQLVATALKTASPYLKACRLPFLFFLAPHFQSFNSLPLPLHLLEAMI